MRSRLISLVLFLLLLLAVGRYVTGSLQFFLGAFWSNAALLTLLLTALIDQPFFSKDANVLLNTSAATISLLGVPTQERGTTWWVLTALCVGLLGLSYGVMWALSLAHERPSSRVVGLARLLRRMGSPRTLFSTLFFWAVIRKFGFDTTESNILFLYWSVFLMYDFIGLSSILDAILYPGSKTDDMVHDGVVQAVTEPNLLQISLEPESMSQIGDIVTVGQNSNQTLATGILLDDRTLVGRRIGHVLVLESSNSVKSALGASGASLRVFRNRERPENAIVGMVETRTNISALRTIVRPDTQLRTGQLLHVALPNGKPAYYQVTQAEIQDVKTGSSDSFRSVTVEAQQLGIWDPDKSSFEPYTWVPSAGSAVNALSLDAGEGGSSPSGYASVGHVPYTKFQVNVNVNDLVTHNTAILGVTGSGKSFLAFTLIEAIIAERIKVLVLDPSRQYFGYLQKFNPVLLNSIEAMEAWINSESLVGVYEFDSTKEWTQPHLTAWLTQWMYKKVSAAALEPGVDMPAKLCLVLEEAHSLIPEWNQVADRDDVNYVNQTAKVVLQGRKYGLGMIVITQRTANVTKTILNQCNTIFALRAFDQTGLDFLANYVGERFAQVISSLPPRHSVLVGKASASPHPLIVELDTLPKEHWLPPTTPSVEAAAAEASDRGADEEQVNPSAGPTHEPQA